MLEIKRFSVLYKKFILEFHEEYLMWLTVFIHKFSAPVYSDQ